MLIEVTKLRAAKCNFNEKSGISGKKRIKNYLTYLKIVTKRQKEKSLC